MERRSGTCWHTRSSAMRSEGGARHDCAVPAAGTLRPLGDAQMKDGSRSGFMQRGLMVGCLVAGLGMLSGCVGGGYAFSDTYHGGIYEEPASPPSYAAPPQWAARRSSRYHARYLQHHREIAYRFGG